MKSNRIWRETRTLLTLILAVAACGELTETSAWQCELAITMDDRTASGSGSESTQQEALDQAFSVACAQLGLTGNALSLCEAGRNPGASSWSTDYDCETA